MLLITNLDGVNSGLNEIGEDFSFLASIFFGLLLLINILICMVFLNYRSKSMRTFLRVFTFIHLVIILLCLCIGQSSVFGLFDVLACIIFLVVGSKPFEEDK